MMAFWQTCVGVSLLLLVIYDVYVTILHARGRSGRVGELLYRAVWSLARMGTGRMSRGARHRTLNFIGPMLLPLLLFTYICLLTIGFALIYVPRMPTQFVFADGARTGAWLDAVYFSGITLVTLGYGDIIPRGLFVRFVALGEGMSGFALISLGVTYLITVYNALERKRTIAQSFYHQAEEGADAAGFIANHFVAGQFYGLENVLRGAARDLNRMLEAHLEHPVIHFFHPLEVHKSFPRVLFLLLETCAVIKSCLAVDEYRDLGAHPEVRTLEASAEHVLSNLVAVLGLTRHVATDGAPSAAQIKRWRRRFEQTIEHLQQSGIKTRPDREAGWEFYRARRADWEAQLYLFARFLGYDWDEVTGDRDLRDATESKDAA